MMPCVLTSPTRPGVRAGQSILEFSFGCMIVMVILFGLIQAVRWSMLEAAERRFDYERNLTSGTNALQQLDPNFHTIRRADLEFLRK